MSTANSPLSRLIRRSINSHNLNVNNNSNIGNNVTNNINNNTNNRRNNSNNTSINRIFFDFLDRSGVYSPIRHIYAPTYKICDQNIKREQNIECDGLCLLIDIEIEHRRNIDYQYWADYALKQNGIQKQIGTINPEETQIYMTIYDEEQTDLYQTWQLPLVAKELIFATTVPRSGYWRVGFTFLFKDNMGNLFIGQSHDDFAQNTGLLWECRDFVFPNAFITFAGIKPLITPLIDCIEQNNQKCTIIQENVNILTQ